MYCFWNNVVQLYPQAHTFIARPDLKRPPARMAYSIPNIGKKKLRDNLTAEVKIGRLSATVYDDLSGLVRIRALVMKDTNSGEMVLSICFFLQFEILHRTRRHYIDMRTTHNIFLPSREPLRPLRIFTPDLQWPPALQVFLSS